MSYALDTSTQNSKVVHINSVDATTILQSGLTTYFSFVLKENFVCPSNQSILISLHSATIPYSFYNIREGVNDIVPVYNTTGASTTLLQIPTGNYTAATLSKKLETLMSGLTGIGDVVVAFDRTTMKFLFQTDVADNNKLKFKFAETTAGAFIELGFGENEESSFLTNTGIYSTNVVDVNGSVHGVYLRTNLSLDGSYDSLSKGLSTILARVPIDVNFGGVLFFNPINGSVHKIEIPAKYVHTLTLRLTDERNRLLDLNGLNFVVSIQFDFVNKNKEIVPPISHRYLKLQEDKNKEDKRLKRNKDRRKKKK
jgi:hypothetical protein